jgi:hypothetical protein
MVITHRDASIIASYIRPFLSLHFFRLQIQTNIYDTKMVTDIGKASHSPSSALMELVNINHEMDWSDFNHVVKFLEVNLDKVIKEVHGFDKLLIDDGKTQLNCPPAPEPGDSHGSLLLRTLIEKEGFNGILLKREFKVYDHGVDPEDEEKHKVQIREDIVKAPEKAGKPPVMTENKVTVSIYRSA